MVDQPTSAAIEDLRREMAENLLNLQATCHCRREVACTVSVFAAWIQPSHFSQKGEQL